MKDQAAPKTGEYRPLYNGNISSIAENYRALNNAANVGGGAVWSNIFAEGLWGNDLYFSTQERIQMKRKVHLAYTISILKSWAGGHTK
jgi:hypothetical protein